MKKLFYPALFHKAEEGGFWVSFPDLPECLTDGDDMEQAYEMAVDALGLALTSREGEKSPLPAPSTPDTVFVEPGSFLVIIEFDMAAYKKKTNSRAVKKTLSIPEWLNEEATAMGVNFSQVLQEALIEKLQARP
ncbi:type II toxin-antitoxin system HicB family antitoxin [Lacrimispora sp.]|uniref:type II toxin-antitoxin system HicB family antitoxin n=1 Tax=Lacrimispora sp. TaxID=2719234 RepID=UPI003460D51D